MSTRNPLLWSFRSDRLYIDLDNIDRRFTRWMEASRDAEMITIKNTSLKFTYGNCCLCCFVSIFKKTKKYLMEEFKLGVNGCTDQQILKVIRKLSKSFKKVENKKRIGITKFILNVAKMNKEYIVVFRGHIMHVSNKVVYDNYGKTVILSGEIPLYWYEIKLEPNAKRQNKVLL